MLAWLKLLPLKDWLYCGAIAVIIAGFLTYSAHERSIGAAKVAGQDAKLAALQTQRNAAISTLAASRLAHIGDSYDATLNAPIPDSPHVFVRNCPAAPRSSGLPSTAGHPGGTDATPDSAETAPRDIGPPIDKAGRDADALIASLQQTVQTLVKAMCAAAQTAPTCHGIVP